MIVVFLNDFSFKRRTWKKKREIKSLSQSEIKNNNPRPNLCWKKLISVKNFVKISGAASSTSFSSAKRFLVGITVENPTLGFFLIQRTFAVAFRWIEFFYLFIQEIIVMMKFNSNAYYFNCTTTRYLSWILNTVVNVYNGFSKWSINVAVPSLSLETSANSVHVLLHHRRISALPIWHFSSLQLLMSLDDTIRDNVYLFI